MISFFNRLIFFLLVLTLTNCSTNKTFTTLDKDFRKVDVSSWTFNASTTAFTLGEQVGNVNQLIVSLNGVIQNPSTDYNLEAGGENLAFTTAPNSADSCFVMVMGDVGGPPIVTGGVTADMLAANLKTFSEFTRTSSLTDFPPTYQATDTLTFAPEGQFTTVL